MKTILQWLYLNVKWLKEQAIMYKMIKYLIIIIIFIILIMINPLWIPVLAENIENISEKESWMSQEITNKNILLIKDILVITIITTVTICLFLYMYNEFSDTGYNNNNITDVNYLNLIEKSKNSTAEYNILCNETTNTIYYKHSNYSWISYMKDTQLNNKWFYKLSEEEQIAYFKAYMNINYNYINMVSLKEANSNN